MTAKICAGDFNEAKALWEGSNLIEIPIKTSDELRFLVIGY